VTALVTGATGFVGSAVARTLLAQGEQVRVVVRPTSDRRNLRGLDVDVYIGDLQDRKSLDHALRGCESLFHVAADYRLWAPNPEVMYKTNVDGTRSLMLAAAEAGLHRIVYTSSVATLGLHPDGTPADEATPVTIDAMIGPYKRSKYLAEEEVRRLAAEGVPVVIVNPSTPVGPRDVKPTPTGRLIRDAVAGRMPAYVDTGLNIVHVEDVAQGHWLAFRQGRVGERYILGGEDLTLREILEEIARLSGQRPPRLRLPHGVVLPIAYLAEAWAKLTGNEPLATVDGVRLARKRMYFTSARAKAELGYQPRPARDALADAVTWFQQAT
jgi:dihydroflavonol-4-reductase